jgi:CheY-like chemotaxis protein
VSLYHAEAKRREIEFQVTAPRTDCTLKGDPVRLRQILHNLLSNAMKFAPKGRVTLEVHVEDRGEARRLLRLQVADSGIGMTEEQVKNLFQRFQQADRSIYRRFGGSGLGLAIVRGLLDQMGGTIRVESGPGAGTRFMIELELDGVAEAVAAAPVVARTATRKLNVLVVDDVSTNRDIVRRLLVKDGHGVTEAEDGRQAVEAAAASAYDLILMDVDMPVMTGLEATRAIRSGGGASSRARIVALTGFAYESDVAQVRDAGMDGHLAKPISFNAVRELVADVAAAPEQA